MDGAGCHYNTYYTILVERINCEVIEYAYNISYLSSLSFVTTNMYFLSRQLRGLISFPLSLSQYKLGFGLWPIKVAERTGFLASRIALPAQQYTGETLKQCGP